LINKRKPSPDFSDEGLVNISFRSYFFTAFAGATFSVALAAIGRGRRCRRGADACRQSSDQKKIFHKILLFSFDEELGYDFTRAEPTLRKTRRAAVALADAQRASLRARC
jgi:F0F1-type ATP synthase membrane subunit c/vacuolar-type H+-ATPase subunit K